MKKKRKVFLKFEVVSIGDTILAKHTNGNVKGTVTKLYPGSAVIENTSGSLYVIDSNKIIKKF